MVRPKHLFQPVKVNLLKRQPALVCRSKALVVRRMPVLRSHDQFIVALNRIDDRNDFVATGNLKSASRKKIVLDVYNDQCRSEEHTSELQSRENLVCRLL